MDRLDRATDWPLLHGLAFTRARFCLACLCLAFYKTQLLHLLALLFTPLSHGLPFPCTFGYMDGFGRRGCCCAGICAPRKEKKSTAPPALVSIFTHTAAENVSPAGAPLLGRGERTLRTLLHAQRPCIGWTSHLHEKAGIVYTYHYIPVSNFRFTAPPPSLLLSIYYLLYLYYISLISLISHQSSHVSNN